jgi:hypothetical protein
MAGFFLMIPPGNPHFVVKGTSYVNQDMVLYDIMPHMHMVGKAIKVTMTPPDGKPVLIFDIKDWDYNWQETYYFKNPLPLKAGTRLEIEAVYDNSANNPNNPFNPPKAVTLGEQTFNEMCFVFLGGTSNRPGNGLPVTRSQPKKAAASVPQVEKDKDVGKSFAVPFNLTDSGHILVRAKINGKGPFNFIVDTGAPLVYVAVPVAKQIGISGDKKGFTTVESFQVEGGPVHSDFKCIIDTPFQLEGMNALGIAGVELHGVIGYTLLSHYKMEIDPTKDRMKWTKLAFTPPPPEPIGPKNSAPVGLESLGKLMKVFAALLGVKGPPTPTPRGFLGIQLKESVIDRALIVEAVLPKSPAAMAGVMVGDRIVAVEGNQISFEVEGKQLTAFAQATAALGKITAGHQVRIVVQRGDDRKELTLTAGQGL